MNYNAEGAGKFSFIIFFSQLDKQFRLHHVSEKLFFVQDLFLIPLSKVGVFPCCLFCPLDLYIYFNVSNPLSAGIVIMCHQAYMSHTMN